MSHLLLGWLSCDPIVEADYAFWTEFPLVAPPRPDGFDIPVYQLSDVNVEAFLQEREADMYCLGKVDLVSSDCSTITEFAMRAQKLYMRRRAKISCLIDSSFREWKFVSPMEYFSHLKDVSMPTHVVQFLQLRDGEMVSVQ